MVTQTQSTSSLFKKLERLQNLWKFSRRLEDLVQNIFIYMYVETKFMAPISNCKI